jgi:hypothetical protein
MEHHQDSLCEYGQELDRVETSFDCSLEVPGDLSTSCCFAAHHRLQQKLLPSVEQLKSVSFGPWWGNFNGNGATGINHCHCNGATTIDPSIDHVVTGRQHNRVLFRHLFEKVSEWQKEEKGFYFQATY